MKNCLDESDERMEQKSFQWFNDSKNYYKEDLSNEEKIFRPDKINYYQENFQLYKHKILRQKIEHLLSSARFLGHENVRLVMTKIFFSIWFWQVDWIALDTKEMWNQLLVVQIPMFWWCSWWGELRKKQSEVTYVGIRHLRSLKGL